MASMVLAVVFNQDLGTADRIASVASFFVGLVALVLAVEALPTTPWLAWPWVRRQYTEPDVRLTVVFDSPPGTPGADVVRDDPISTGGG